jgi:hypothetical protein
MPGVGVGVVETADAVELKINAIFQVQIQVEGTGAAVACPSLQRVGQRIFPEGNVDDVLFDQLQQFIVGGIVDFCHQRQFMLCLRHPSSSGSACCSGTETHHARMELSVGLLEPLAAGLEMAEPHRQPRSMKGWGPSAR